MSFTVLQAKQESVKKQAEINIAAIFFICFLNWREMKLVRAASKVTWHLLHKYSPSLHLGDL